MKKVNVLGVEFDNLTLLEFKKVFLQRIKDQKSTLIVTANPEIVMQANNDAAFMNLIKNDADFITADGIGIVLAGKIQHIPVKERVTGYDMFVWFLKIANEQKKRVYLIGAKAEIASLVDAKLRKEYPDLQIAKVEDGYFKEDLETVAKRIKAAKPDMVFAALGCPRQEQLLAILKKQGVPAIMMGVGGSFDVFSGKVRRAPKFFQKIHLEWFYRLATNPARIGRMQALPKFIVNVYRHRKN